MYSVLNRSEWTSQQVFASGFAEATSSNKLDIWLEQMSGAISGHSLDHVNSLPVPFENRISDAENWFQIGFTGLHRKVIFKAR